VCHWLKNPQALRPGTVEPNRSMSEDTPYHFGFAVHGDLLCAKGKVGKSVPELWEEVFFEADE
jgi:hypothetical protein